MQRNVYHVGIARFAQAQTASIEHFQHPRVFRQHLGGQQVEAGTARQDYQVAQQRCADTLTLVLINHNKGQLRRARLGDDITAATDDLLLPAVVGRGNERDMRNCSRTNFLKATRVSELPASSRSRRIKLKPRSSINCSGMRM